jgi:hypothetical protein
MKRVEEGRIQDAKRAGKLIPAPDAPASDDNPTDV